MCTKACVKKMAQVKIKKMAQGKIARRLAFARLNAVRCGGGMTPFSHHTGWYNARGGSLTLNARLPTACSTSTSPKLFWSSFLEGHLDVMFLMLTIAISPALRVGCF